MPIINLDEMFLRFIGTEIDLRTGKPKGIFTLAYDLIETNHLTVYEEELLKSLLKWFSGHLPIPNKFSKNKNSSHKNNITTAWFKDSAQEVMKKIWELKQILESNEINVEIVRSEKPGYVIYEDDFQIIVDPF